MKTSQVKKLSVEQRFLYWIKERESIRKKKERGEPKPWTDDKIFQTYKFCNVRRRDDRVSRWLIDNWYEPYFDHPNMLVACALARHFNNPDALEMIGFPDKWRPKTIQRKLENEIKAGRKVFAPAYMVRGIGKKSKVDMVVNSVCAPLVGNPPTIDTDSMQNSVDRLLPYWGFSTFMAGQVVADLRWGMKGSWKDKHKWAPVGPGSSRGIKRLKGIKELGSKMPQKVFDKEFPLVMKLVRGKQPYIYKRMEAIDIQNCLCEWDKMERTLWGQGRPKQLYPGE